MDLIAFVLAWPILVLVFGIVLIALGEVGFLSFLVWPIVIIIFLVALKNRSNISGQSDVDKLESVRRWLVVISISAFLPLLVKYLFDFFDRNIVFVIAALIAGFGFIIWGMFIKNHHVIMQANLIGGGITLIYVYIRLWDLGEGARIIAAAVGLVIAVTISIIKLRDKLS